MKILLKVLLFSHFQIYPGIILGNGETIQNVEYLKKIGVTHVLNTAERHVSVNPAKYPLHGISYFGFHVDDHPMANIARFFGRTTDFIDEALCRNGLIGKFSLKKKNTTKQFFQSKIQCIEKKPTISYFDI